MEGHHRRYRNGSKRFKLYCCYSKHVKNKHKLIGLFAVTALLIVLASVATYFATKHYVFADAYGKGQVTGAKTGYTKGAKKGYQTGWQDAVKLFDTGTHGCDSTPTANDPLGCLPSQPKQGPATTYTSPAPQQDNSIHCTTRTDPTFGGDLPPTSHTDCY